MPAPAAGAAGRPSIQPVCDPAVGSRTQHAPLVAAEVHELRCHSAAGSHGDTPCQRVFLREMLPGVLPCGMNLGSAEAPSRRMQAPLMSDSASSPVRAHPHAGGRGDGQRVAGAGTGRRTQGATNIFRDLCENQRSDRIRYYADANYSYCLGSASPWQGGNAYSPPLLRCSSGRVRLPAPEGKSHLRSYRQFRGGTIGARWRNVRAPNLLASN
jgi:hypothetical protein